TQEPVSPRQLVAKVPRDLETICLKCLRKEAEKRYASAEALAEDLRRWQTDEPIQARPVSALERGVKWVRRNPTRSLAVAASGAVMIAVIAGIGTWQHQRSLRRVESYIQAQKTREGIESALAQ